MPKLEPEVEFSVVTFALELAKYLNFTVRRPGAGCGPPSNPTSNLSPAAACAASPCTLPHPCSRRANLTIHTCLLAQGWRSTSTLSIVSLSIVNKRSCCLVLQVRPRSDPDGLVLRSSEPLAVFVVLWHYRGLLLRFIFQVFQVFFWVIVFFSFQTKNRASELYY